jgi:serine/threonine-protein kinase
MLTLKGNHGTYLFTVQEGKKGKFGGIYKGYRQEDNRPVSAKQLTKLPTEEDLALFKATQQFNHPGLARSFDLISHNQAMYIVREYYEGSCFKDIMSKATVYRKISTDFFYHSAIHILDALQHMHDYGVLHRDIKPANLIVCHAPHESPDKWKPENVKIIDFELSRLFPAQQPVRSPFSLIYSPPEQLLQYTHLETPASDVFAFAITLYEALSGRPPYVDCNAEILLNLQLNYPVKKPPRMSAELFQIIEKAASKSVLPKPPRFLKRHTIEKLLSEGIQQRYQSAIAMKNDLESYLAQRPRKHSWLKKILSRA